MKKENKVFIASSLDGYIAGKSGEIDWLDMIPNPEGLDLGFVKFMSGIDALIMGRASFETVMGFGGEWLYKCPVFVWSSTLKSIPEGFGEKAELVTGSIQEILSVVHNKGYDRLYIDGGKTIQSFLKEDLIDEMIITTIPILLGGGIPLFGELSKRLEFEHVESKVLLNQLVQDHYSRKKK
jgi:dihydrofolate reductase